MESKYYTPDINEFHVGFEYQELWGVIGADEEWIPEIFKTTSSVENLVDVVRVRCLDEDDLTSLGWKIVISDKNMIKAIIEFEWEEDDVPLKGSWNIIFGKDRYCSIIKDMYGQTSFFRGTVKNKSELKKIMEQLDIVRFITSKC